MVSNRPVTLGRIASSMKAPISEAQPSWRIATAKWLVQNHTSRSRNGAGVVSALSISARRSARYIAYDSVMAGRWAGRGAGCPPGIVRPAILPAGIVPPGIAPRGIAPPGIAPPGIAVPAIAPWVAAALAAAAIAIRRRWRSSRSASSPFAVEGAEAIRAGSGPRNGAASQPAGSPGAGSKPRRPSPNRTTACVARRSIAPHPAPESPLAV